MEDLILNGPNKKLGNISPLVSLLSNESLNNSYFLKLTYKIGATLLGIKPAELLSLSLAGSGSSEWENYIKCLRCSTEIGFRETRKKERTLFFVFHSKCLNDTLSEKITLKFLQELGYPPEYSLEKYLDHLLEKLPGCDFPHEVGIFLGYPLKDVMGFLGYLSLEKVKTKGWNYYGHSRMSELRYDLFALARLKTQEVISVWKPEHRKMFSSKSV